MGESWSGMKNGDRIDIKHRIILFLTLSGFHPDSLFPQRRARESFRPSTGVR